MIVMTESAAGPLAGLVVIDLSRALAGPHAGMILGDLGARVIKVETPGTGDDTRGWGPPFVTPDDPAQSRESTYFLSCNRNKESIALDLKSAEGKATLTQLISKADVLLENFRPGVLARLGFGGERLAELNPSLVTLSISGFGHDGPEGGRAGYDQIAQGEAGLMSLTGSGPDDPQRVGVPIGDLLAGLYGVIGVLAGLVERAATRRGQLVRTSLLGSIVGVHAFQGTRWTVAGEVGHAQGNHHPSISPYGLFRCANGSVQIAVGSEGLWKQFCAAFEHRRRAQQVWRRTRIGWPTGTRSSSWWRRHSPTPTPRPCWASSPTPASRPARSAPSTRCTSGSRPGRNGCSSTSNTRRSGTTTLPGSPLRFFLADLRR